MINFVAGKHRGMEDDGALCILTESGVGYRVVVSDRDRNVINCASGDYVELWCRTVMHESDATIYGFLDLDDRRAFDRICKVKGLGPSKALKVLSVMDARALKETLDCGVTHGGAVERITRIPGFATKTAQALFEVRL